MLVNKSGGRLVIGRINVKRGEVLPGIPYTADERKGIEKMLKKGYIVEVEETKPEPIEEPKAEPVVEEVKAEPVVEEVKAEPVVETKPTPTKYSRRRKKAEEAEPVAKEDGVADND